MISGWIPMDQYQDIMYYAVKQCRDDKDFDKIHKQLEQTRVYLIRNVENFDVVIKNVEGLVVERRKELEELEELEEHKSAIGDYGPQQWRMVDGAYVMIRGDGRKTTIRGLKNDQVR